jgi:hypothetical protein
LQRFLLIVVTLTGGALMFSPPAAATNPGANGKIVFLGTSDYLYAVNPDGSGLKRFGPRWLYNATAPHVA